MARPKVTKTLGPIHFEDLEPHRFEDLIGDLIYDFKEWQSIESTGRGGSDDGFDIRAWERTQIATNIGEDEENEEGIHPMNGNLWMIQCKREKSLGPKRVGEIVNENIKPQNIPYGYILVAPVNFSKKSYDIFRDELIKKGVMEFYLWGNGDLERMLYMPKYDHVLFAFFGLSLITKRRSRTSEIKFVVNNKNKLLRILTGGEHTQDAHKSILVRDINDENYPHKEAYSDFEKNPRWQEHIAFGYIPNGLLIHKRKYYAFIDDRKKEFDFSDSVDLINRESEMDNNEEDFEKNKAKREANSKVEYFWNHLPRKNKAHLCVEVSIPFENILVIDEKGDISYKSPHLFVEFKYKNTPFDHVWPFLTSEDNKSSVNLDREKYKRIKIFPERFLEIKRGKIHKKTIKIKPEVFLSLERDKFQTFFDIQNEFDFLKVKDVFSIESTEKKIESDQEKLILEITHKYSTTLREYKDDHPENYYVGDMVDLIAGKKIKGDKKITIFEMQRIYDWKIRDKFKEKASLHPQH